MQSFRISQPRYSANRSVLRNLDSRSLQASGNTTIQLFILHTNTHTHTSIEQLLLCTKNYHLSLCFDGLPRGLSGQKKKKKINPPANAGVIGGASSVPKSGRSPGGRNGNPLQYSCLENPMDRGAWWATEPGTPE